MRTALISLIIVVALGIGIWAITSGGDTANENSNLSTNTANINASNRNTTVNTNTTSNLNTNTDAANTNSNLNVGTVQITMTSKEYAFSPASITAKPGQTIQITLTNNGNMEHDFRITELGVNSGLIGPGETETITFTVPSTVKNYEYFCGVGSHRALGQKGTLSVAN